MIDVVPARPWMAAYLRTQRAQISAGEITAEDIKACAATGVALACVRGGQVLSIGGISQQWEGRGLLWGVVSDSIGATMTPIHRVVARALDECPFKRIEAHILDSFDEAHRWIRLLGFEREGVMRCFWRGEDYALYARLRG